MECKVSKKNYLIWLK